MSKENYRRIYKHHKTGKIGYWEGWIEPCYPTSDWSVHTQWAAGEHDAVQFNNEFIREGKQGRSVKEQALFRLDSRTKNKLDSGYVLDKTDARAVLTDQQGRPKPMLAQKFRDFKGRLDTDRTHVQLKYNGHRCLILCEHGVNIAISRNGNLIPGIPHILDGLHLDHGMILDGEIYRHGWKLQQIASAAKRYQSVSKELTYVTYDTILDECFSKRIAFLKELETNGNLCDAVKVAPTIRLGNTSVPETLKKALSRGYEGLILRREGVPYEIGRRSNSLLKVKQLDDGEFEVIDVLSSKDGWGILVCKNPPGGTFKVSAPGTVSEKTRVLKHKGKYIGQLVTVEYSELTADNKPFHPVALQFREDL